jgi:RNA polymerase sigma-70 factor (ECF subfamily)
MRRGDDNGRRTLRLVSAEAEPARLPRPSPATEDVALAAALLDRDRDALVGLVAEHAPKVLAVVRRYARAPHDARDLAEQSFRRAFAAAHRALRRDPQRAVPFGRWVMRATLRIAKDHLRRELYLAGARLAQLGPAEALGAGRPPPRAERARRVRTDVLQLPARLREVLTLRLDPELPFPRIAEVLQITEAAAVLNLHEAAALLRARSGAAPAPVPCVRYEVSLSRRAVGALAREDAGRVEAHLAGCGACAAAADATADTLGLAALDRPSAGERAILEALPARVVARVERAAGFLGARRWVVAAALAAVSSLGIVAALLANRLGH